MTGRELQRGVTRAAVVACCHMTTAAQPAGHYLHQLLQAGAFFRGEQAGMEVTAVPVLVRIIRLRVCGRNVDDHNVTPALQLTWGPSHVTQHCS